MPWKTDYKRSPIYSWNWNVCYICEPYQVFICVWRGVWSVMVVLCRRVVVFIGISTGWISCIWVANNLTPTCSIATITQIHNTKITELNTRTWNTKHGIPGFSLSVLIYVCSVLYRYVYILYELLLSTDVDLPVGLYRTSHWRITHTIVHAVEAM